MSTCNNAVKGRTHCQKMSKNQQELAGIQKEPEIIKNLFKAPKVLHTLESPVYSSG